ncbi:hypothetical protein ACE0DR_17945 [Azotobacter sp. CWF10]
MKRCMTRVMLVGLFAFVAAGSASANPQGRIAGAAVAVAERADGNPWATAGAGPLLAYEHDHHRHDHDHHGGVRHQHRDAHRVASLRHHSAEERRRNEEHWRAEEHRRAMERHRAAQRHAEAHHHHHR